MERPDTGKFNSQQFYGKWARTRTLLHNSQIPDTHKNYADLYVKYLCSVFVCGFLYGTS